MVQVRIAVGDDGTVTRVEIQGHANYAGQGADPACAAISVLVKSYAVTMTEQSAHTVYGTVDTPGEFLFGLKDTSNSEHAHAAGRMLVNGIRAVQNAFSDAVTIEIANEKSERSNGARKARLNNGT